MVVYHTCTYNIYSKCLYGATVYLKRKMYRLHLSNEYIPSVTLKQNLRNYDKSGKFYHHGSEGVPFKHELNENISFLIRSIYYMTIIVFYWN